MRTRYNLIYKGSKNSNEQVAELLAYGLKSKLLSFNEDGMYYDDEAENSEDFYYLKECALALVKDGGEVWVSFGDYHNLPDKLEGFICWRNYHNNWEDEEDEDEFYEGKSQIENVDFLQPGTFNRLLNLFTHSFKTSQNKNYASKAVLTGLPINFFNNSKN